MHGNLCLHLEHIKHVHILAQLFLPSLISYSEYSICRPSAFFPQVYTPTLQRLKPSASSPHTLHRQDPARHAGSTSHHQTPHHIPYSKSNSYATRPLALSPPYPQPASDTSDTLPNTDSYDTPHTTHTPPSRQTAYSHQTDRRTVRRKSVQHATPHHTQQQLPPR